MAASNLGIELSGQVTLATPGSAAYDLYAQQTIEMHPFHTYSIPTGVFSKFDPRIVALFRERSGMALKGFRVHAGVIDSDYSQEWKIICSYQGSGTYLIQTGDKIAQVLFLERQAVAGITPVNMTRTGGFGSTGK